MTKDQGPKTMTKRRFNWFLLIRLSGIVLFIIILTRIDIGEVWSQIKLIRWNIFIVTLGLVLVQLFLKALRWHLINSGTRNEKIPLRSFGEFFESYAIGIVTPGRLGELLKAGYSKDHSGKISTGVRVMVERGFDFGFFLCTAGAALAWGKIVDQGFGWGLLTIFLGLTSISISVALLMSPKIYILLGRFSKFLKISDQPIDHKIRTGPFSLWLLLISMASNSIYFFSCYLLAMSVFFDAGLLYISGGVAVAGLLNTLPVTVMGLGTRELAFLYVFHNYPSAVIMAFSAIVFLCWQIGSGILSMLSGEILLAKFSKRAGK